MSRLSDRSFRALVIAAVFAAGALVTAAPDLELSRNRYVAFYNLQADAFLSRRVDLDLPADWYHDVIDRDGRKYFALPPLNGFLLVPFVAAFGRDFPERLFTLGGYALYLFVLSRYVLRFAQPRSRPAYALWMVFLGLGTDLLVCTAEGTPWFSAALVSSLLLAAALLVHVRAARLAHHVLAVALVCVAALGRLHLALLVGPFVLVPWLGPLRRRPLALAALAVPPLVFLAFVAWWNRVRFGAVLDLHYREHGYGAAFAEDIARYGFTSWRYLFAHLYHGLVGAPPPRLEFPFFGIDRYGNGLFATSPLFLYMLFRKPRYAALDRFALGCTILVAIPIFTHFSTGWSQFGYRYVLDVLPFLLVLLMRASFRITSPLSLALVAVSLWYHVVGTVMSFMGL